MIRYIITFCLLILTSFSIQAEMLKKCVASLSRDISFAQPTNMRTSNMMWHEVGSAFMPKGQLIVLEGYLYDDKCTPIQDATIELWQYNDDHKKVKDHYVNLPEKNALSKDTLKKIDEDVLQPNRLFTGSGMATTDNEGYFVFFTILPSPLKKLPPHVNLTIYHDHFKFYKSRLEISPEKYDTIYKVSGKPILPKFWLNEKQVYIKDIDKYIDQYTTNIMLEPESQYRRVAMPPKAKQKYTPPDNAKDIKEEKEDEQDLKNEAAIVAANSDSSTASSKSNKFSFHGK